MTDAEILEHYTNSQCSETTGAAAGCCAATVLTIVRRQGGEVQPRGRAGKSLYAFGPHGHSKFTMEQVAEAYRAGRSGPEIARDAGITHSAVYAALRRMNVPLRQSVAEMAHHAKAAGAKRTAERKAAGKIGFGFKTPPRASS